MLYFKFFSKWNRFCEQKKLQYWTKDDFTRKTTINKMIRLSTILSRLWIAYKTKSILNWKQMKANTTTFYHQGVVGSYMSKFQTAHYFFSFKYRSFQFESYIICCFFFCADAQQLRHSTYFHVTFKINVFEPFNLCLPTKWRWLWK